MFDDAKISIILDTAAKAGLEAPSLLAIIELESAGRFHAEIRGKPEPLIRFEGHYFDRRLSGLKRIQARTAGLASPDAGAVRNPASQLERWKLLERACSIDRQAAYESTSWGMGQVMGAHWKLLGFNSVDVLVSHCRSGFTGQLDLMIRFILQSNLQKPLAAKDWKAFARAYNGPAFAKNRYDERLGAAYRKYDLLLKSRKSAPLAEAEKPKPAPRPDRLLQSATPVSSARPLLFRILADWFKRKPPEEQHSN